MGAYGTTVLGLGTTAGSCGSTAQKRSTTASLRRAGRKPSFRRDNGETDEHSEELEERRCRRECVCEIPPKPFQNGPPLNSTALLRLNSTEPNRRETPSSIIFEGHQIVLCLVVIYL